MALPRSKLTAQGQISIPAEVRRKLGVGPGAVLEWDEADGEIVVRRAGRYSSEDIHRAVFADRVPARKSVEEMKQGIRRLIKKRQNAPVRRRTVLRLLAAPRQILEPAKTVIGKPPPPMADDPRLNPHFLGNRARAAALRRQQHDPCPPHIALGRRRRPATSLKHLAFLRLQPNFSCFGNHPNLESRITHEEK